MIKRIERINLPSALWMLSLLTLSGLIVVFCFIAASSLEREAIARQQVRADKIAVRIDEKFLIIEQLVRTMAALVAPMRSRPQVERLLETVLGSTDGQFVYGVGVWFEPYVFSPQERYIGPYVHRAAAGDARTILTYEWTTPSYDFHSHAWYRAGLLARDPIAFVEHVLVRARDVPQDEASTRSAHARRASYVVRSGSSAQRSISTWPG